MISHRSALQMKSPPANRKARVSRFLHLLGIALLLTTLLASSSQYARAGGTFVVTVLNDGDDLTPGDGICDIGLGACTLRAAIQEANAYAGADAITFNLAGSGIQTLDINSSPLPDITEAVMLDGTSQPGCVVPCIALSGSAASGPGNNGLTLASNGSTIKGLIITSWVGGDGISVTGDNNIIQSNDIGFWPGSIAPLPNNVGISLVGSSNLVGGAQASQRNVISGNSFEGIIVANPGCCTDSTSNVVRNNYIGTNPAGSAARGNDQSGILLNEESNWAVIRDNLISGNQGWGIVLTSARDTAMYGNKIGTNAAGTAALGNGLGGILLQSGAIYNFVGGTLAGQPNNISYNHGPGVSVINVGTLQNRIQRNSIFANTRLGIDLGRAGVTPNDSRDMDGGPNMLQNYPVLSAATSATRLITGSLNSMPNRDYMIEFYSSPAGSCDASGHGEGKKFIGARAVTTNAAGIVSFSYRTPAAFGVGQVITATAMDNEFPSPLDTQYGTSEFSVCSTAK